MAIECFVIDLILAIIIFSFAHANRIRWVIATIPFGIMPLANAVADTICNKIFKTPITSNAGIIIILVSAMISCIWIGIMSGFLNSKRMRIPYIIIGVFFNLILGLILIYYYMNI